MRTIILFLAAIAAMVPATASAGGGEIHESERLPTDVYGGEGCKGCPKKKATPAPAPAPAAPVIPDPPEDPPAAVQPTPQPATPVPEPVVTRVTIRRELRPSMVQLGVYGLAAPGIWGLADTISGADNEAFGLDGGFGIYAGIGAHGDDTIYAELRGAKTYGSFASSGWQVGGSFGYAFTEVLALALAGEAVVRDFWATDGDGTYEARRWGGSGGFDFRIAPKIDDPWRVAFVVGPRVAHGPTMVNTTGEYGQTTEGAIFGRLHLGLGVP